MKLSKLAEEITTSPILTIAAEINARIKQGEKIFNLTVGDFDPQYFPIPERLTSLIIDAYKAHQTNYPGAFGLSELRLAIAEMISTFCNIDLKPDELLIASGSRPLIYSLYKTVVNPGEKVLFPVPSWNNDYYCQLLNAEAVIIDTTAKNNFFPSASDLEPYVQDAAMIALCSPQNPTGTLMSKQQLTEICELVVNENKRRSPGQKPLYIMFDQVYWLLTFSDSGFFHALNVCPEIRDYAIFIDGLSKGFAGTGVRVGWANGPLHVIAKMRALVAHIGAWAPKPEQVAVAQFLGNLKDVNQFLQQFRFQLQSRLQDVYQGFMDLKSKGYDVDAIAPQAAIYLSLRINLIGKKTAEGKLLNTHEDVHQYLLNQAGIGILPFSWFGANNQAEWYRISVGSCSEQQIDEMLKQFESALSALN